MPLIAERVPGAGRVKGAATPKPQSACYLAAAGEAFTLDSTGIRHTLCNQGLCGSIQTEADRPENFLKFDWAFVSSPLTHSGD